MDDEEDLQGWYEAVDGLRQWWEALDEAVEDPQALEHYLELTKEPNREYSRLEWPEL